MHKLIYIILGICLFIFAANSSALAYDKKTYVTIDNKVVGDEGWLLSKQTPLDLPKFFYNESTHSATPITWLLRFDAINSSTISGYFSDLISKDKLQSLGILTDITPNVCIKTGLTYIDQRLTSYLPQDRLKLLREIFDTFKEKFGFYPKQISSDYVDSYSLAFLNKEYTVYSAIIDCPHNFPCSPYIPSSHNAYIPGKSQSDRINMVISHFSDRHNPKFSLDLYTTGKLNEVAQVNFGFINNNNLLSDRASIKDLFVVLDAYKYKPQYQVSSIEDASGFLLTFFPETSPSYFYRTSDGYWYQNTNYSLHLKSLGDKTILDYLLVNNPKIYESNYSTSNNGLRDENNIFPQIDSYSFPKTQLELDFNPGSVNISGEYWRIYLSSDSKKISLLPDRIKFENIVGQPKEIILTPKTPFSIPINKLLLCLLIPLLLIYSIKPGKLFWICFLLIIPTLLPVITNGYLYSFGSGFWGPNGHDAIFHLSLIEKFALSPTNFSHPQLAGETLGNYHFIFDYLSGLTVWFTGIPAINVYFFLFPVVIAILLIHVLIKLLSSWGYRPGQIILGTFFAFLTGSFGFLFTLIRDGNLFSGESLFWSNQSVSLFLNPPFVLSLLFLLTFLLLLSGKRTWQNVTLLVLLGGLLAQTKIYAFLLLCAGLLLSGQFGLLIGVGIAGIFISLPFTSLASSPFMLNPLWFAQSMFASNDRLFYPKLAQAWQTYELSKNIPKLFIVNFVAVAVFYIGNLGVRLFGLSIGLMDRQKTISERVTYYICFTGLLIPLIITQLVNPWNSIQFMYYSLFFLGIFTGKYLYLLLKREKPRFIPLLLTLVIIIFAIPTTIGTLRDYVSSMSASRVDYTELQALSKLKDLPRGTVLSYVLPPENKVAGNISTPKPLYAYVSTAYISAFSGQPEYVADTINLDITGYDYTARLKNVYRFFATKDKKWAQGFLRDNNIGYVYETPIQRLGLTPSDLCLTPIFDSGEINLYKFNCHE